ncbi:Uma2 family endonuclease [Gloeobacter morelensis]|nr:Uma2 family endonuclease [Gloeobacter morelensis]
MTDEQYFQLCRANRDLRFERSAKGELIIMPPAGGKSGGRNFRLTQQLANWTDTNDLGTGFDSSTGFKLPNGADRSPDAAWVRLERWKALTAEEQDRFVPLCPDFVAELRSKTDSIKGLRLKMQEYLDNGAQLGWLIDPQARKVEIYRPGLPVEVLDNPERLSGEPVLPGFVLNLAPIWA